MITGYEGYTLPELERIATRENNQLALEIFERMIRADEPLFHKLMTDKPRTQYVAGQSRLEL